MFSIAFLLCGVKKRAQSKTISFKEAKNASGAAGKSRVRFCFLCGFIIMFINNSHSSDQLLLID